MVIGGVTGIEVAGVAYSTSDTANYDPRSESVESVVADEGRVGRAVSGMAPFIEVGIRLDERQRVADLTEVRDKTVILSCRDGKQITLEGADFVGDANMDARQQLMTARFEGRLLREVL